MTRFNRITRDPAIMGGKACIRGMRYAAWLAEGQELALAHGE